MLANLSRMIFKGMGVLSAAVANKSSGLLRHRAQLMGLEFVDVHHAYDGVRVLGGVSLLAERGAVTCLVGASGSGKTTLLRLAAGMLKVQAGEIRLDGQLVANVQRSPPPEKRDIGLVFQEGALFPHLSVAQNVGFGLLDATMRDARVAELLSLIGLSQYARRRPHELSGGQQQRVALARALAPSPRVLLLDEPFGSLDARTRRELRNDVREILNSQNTVAILVTHDPEEAMEMGDRIVYLEDGQIVQSGSATTFYDTPMTAEVARTFSMANVVDAVIGSERVSSTLGDWPLDCLRDTRTPAGHIRLAVRPEDLITTTQDGVAGEATVLGSRRMGPDTIVSGRTASGQRWVTRLSHADGPAIGAAVSLAPVTGSVMTFTPNSKTA